MYDILRLYGGLRIRCLWRMIRELKLAAVSALLLLMLLGLSSYLVWVGVKFSNAKEEELLINDASQIGSKKFDFSIE